MNIIKQVKHLTADIKYELKTGKHIIEFTDFDDFDQTVLSTNNFKEHIMLSIYKNISLFVQIDHDSINNLIIDSLKTTHTFKYNDYGVLHFINNSINCDILQCNCNASLNPLNSCLLSVCDSREQFIVITYSKSKKCVEYLINKYNAEEVDLYIFYLTKKPFLTKRAIK